MATVLSPVNTHPSQQIMGKLVMSMFLYKHTCQIHYTIFSLELQVPDTDSTGTDHETLQPVVRQQSRFHVNYGGPYNIPVTAPTCK